MQRATVAARRGAVAADKLAKWLVCFKKLAFFFFLFSVGRVLRGGAEAKKKKNHNLFKHSELLAPVVWGINVNTLQDRESVVNS